jgi:hypothetical protein
MINRRTALDIIASARTVGASGLALAKQKNNLEAQKLCALFPRRRTFGLE